MTGQLVGGGPPWFDRDQAKPFKAPGIGEVYETRFGTWVLHTLLDDSWKMVDEAAVLLVLTQSNSPDTALHAFKEEPPFAPEEEV